MRTGRLVETWLLAAALTLGAMARHARADDTDWALDMEKRVKAGYSPTREETIRYQNVAHRLILTHLLTTFRTEYTAKSGDAVVLDVMPDLSAGQPVEVAGIPVHPGEWLEVAAITTGDVQGLVATARSAASPTEQRLPSKTADGGYIVVTENLHGASNTAFDTEDVITVRFTCTSTDPRPIGVVVFVRGRKVEAPPPRPVASVEPSAPPIAAEVAPHPADTVEPDQAREDRDDGLSARLGIDFLTPSSAMARSSSFATFRMERIYDAARAGHPGVTVAGGYTIGYATNFEGDLHVEIGGAIHAHGLRLALLAGVGSDIYRGTDGQFDHRGYYADVVARLQLGLGRVGLVGTAALLTGGE